MKRAVLISGLAALAATLLPVPALADDSGAVTACPFSPVPTAAAPVGTEACPGVRPGGRMIIGSRLCTLNFLFQAPDGTRYIGAAGHCMAWEIDWLPEKVFAPGDGPMAVGGDGKRFGEFAYAVFERDADHGLARDFAVIRLDPGVDASPEMCHFGAPRDLFTTDTADPVVLNYYGNGTASGAVAGDVPPARSAVAFGTPNPDRIWAEGVVVQGDGGAGVMTADGLAIGVIATSGPARPGSKPPVPSEKGGDVGTIGITRLAPQLARASEQLGVPLELVTAS